MAAAVADWRPAEPVDGKREKCDGEWSPRMVRTEDIIATLAASSARPRCLVGFAAEADDVVARADAKRARKGHDAIVANKIGPGGAFGSASNHVWMLREGSTPVEVGPAPKGEVAARIISWVASWASEERRIDPDTARALAGSLAEVSAGKPSSGSKMWMCLAPNGWSAL